jgi:hypothetical protein
MDEAMRSGVSRFDYLDIKKTYFELKEKWFEATDPGRIDVISDPEQDGIIDDDPDIDEIEDIEKGEIDEG